MIAQLLKNRTKVYNINVMPIEALIFSLNMSGWQTIVSRASGKILYSYKAKI